MRTLHVILPNDIDDPAAPSGGNAYDRRLCDGLARLGWSVAEHPVLGGWPAPTPTERAGLAGVLSGLPDGSLVLVDGLVGSAVPELLGGQSDRLRLVLLVHLPLGDDAEARALSAASAVLTTSDWTRTRLLELYRLPAGSVHAAPPGVDPAPAAAGSAAGSELLCVAAVAAHKGHDLLLAALAALSDLSFRCVCIGRLDRDPAFVARLRREAAEHGLADRISFAGPRPPAALEAAYDAADLLVLASRGETYGMVVTEALARAVPVLATAVGGLPEALGRTRDGERPGLLVPPEDPVALAGALRAWLTSPGLRSRLRARAAERRGALTGWGFTAERVDGVLSRVA